MYKETNAHEYHSTNQESTNQHNTKYQLGRSFGLFKIGSWSNGVILWLSQVVTNWGRADGEKRKPAKSNWQDSCSAKCSMVMANCVSHFIRSPGQQETTNPGKTLGGRVSLSLTEISSFDEDNWDCFHTNSPLVLSTSHSILGHSSGTNCSPSSAIYNYHFPWTQLSSSRKPFLICWSLLILSFLHHTLQNLNGVYLTRLSVLQVTQPDCKGQNSTSPSFQVPVKLMHSW